MGEKTAAQKKAQQKYMDKFAVARVRLAPDKYEQIKAHADEQGESLNTFFNRAICETMENDRDRDIMAQIAREHGISVERVKENVEFAHVLDRYPKLKQYIFDGGSLE